MASPRRAVLRRSGDETAAASAMLNTFFRDARMFSGTIWVQRAAYKTVSNDTTSKRARFVLNVIKRLGSPRGAYRAACMRTSQNSVYATLGIQGEKEGPKPLRAPARPDVNAMLTSPVSPASPA